jgi:rod shape-determining protein MreC
MAVLARGRSTRSLVLLLVTVSLVTITIDYRQGKSGPLGAIGRGALTVITPLQEAVSKVTRPIGDFLSTLTEIPSLRGEIERLEDELDEARRALVAVQAVEEENQDWEELFELSRLTPQREIGARVIASGVSNLEWTVTIDVGSDDGVAQNMPVLDPDGLAGRVISVTSSSAVVLLAIDPDSHVSGKIVSSDLIGTLQGAGGDNDLQMEFVGSDVPVEAGSIVVTAGLEGGLYPANLPVGEVARVLSTPGAPTQVVEVRPYVDFSALDNLVVVLTGTSG